MQFRLQIPELSDRVSNFLALTAELMDCFWKRLWKAVLQPQKYAYSSECWALIPNTWVILSQIFIDKITFHTVTIFVLFLWRTTPQIKIWNNHHKHKISSFFELPAHPRSNNPSHVLLPISAWCKDFTFFLTSFYFMPKTEIPDQITPLFYQHDFIIILRKTWDSPHNTCLAPHPQKSRSLTDMFTSGQEKSCWGMFYL